MSSITSLPDPCQAFYEDGFSDELLAPYAATYTFCQEAAMKCVDSAVGTANVSTVTVSDLRSYNTTTDTRLLYYFYSQSFVGDDGRLTSCLAQNGLDNVTMFWAPGQEARNEAQLQGNSASRSFRKPPSSSRSLLQSLSFALAFVFVFQHLVGTANASSLPYSLPHKRGISCAKFEPTGEPNSTFLTATKVGDLVSCHQQKPPCVVEAYDTRHAFPYDYDYRVDGRSGQPLTFDTQALINNSFNATLVERYSIANRHRASSPSIAIHSGSRSQNFVQAFKLADTYDGTFTQCQDNQTYPGSLTLPIGAWRYSLTSNR